ncbi:hypothetical protein VMCG_09275 [Cytospora schulzeri]|uniref:Cytochrome P450 n=1 Tax=Cytospora schulzeri TaxID=448051 RepID=A0A423VMP2_9PEZI|nr:hypothetical protein VMCG_09275 [Valsa malicola]
MVTTKNSASSLLELLSNSFVQTTLALGIVILLASVLARPTSRSTNATPIPHVPETVPYVSNTIHYLLDVAAFLDRVSELLKSTQSDIVKSYLGFRPFYFVAGQRNVQKLFGSPEILDGDFLHFILMDKQWGMTKIEMAKFREDKSGRLAKPLPGSENLGPDKRYWRNHNRLYTDYLTDTRHSEALVGEFTRRFSQRLDQQVVDVDEGWGTVSLLDTVRTHMFECAVETLFGTRVFDLNPGFTKCYWEYDEVAPKFLGGLPIVFQPRAARIKDRIHAMVRRHIDAAWDSFDWNGPDADALWEPHFGSRLSRESARWLREQGFSDHVIAGHTLATLFGLNGNSVAITAWAVAELLQDPPLLTAVRSEILTGAVNKETGELDAQRVVGLPLLLSVYTEIMRLHVSFSVTREVRRGPFEFSPGCWAETGAIIQTCTTDAHLDEKVWDVDGHPASQFWAYRHVRTEEILDERTGQKVIQTKFAMRGRPTSFFPYGGGYWLCPGRHFGKMEIMLALALIVAKRDLEFVGWTNLDGTKSDRPARNDLRYAGSIAMFPDRDVCLRWRKAQ